jgi:hypothetical protein
VDPSSQAVDLAGNLLQGGGIDLFNGQGQQDSRLLDVFVQAVKGVDALAEKRAFL